MSEERSPLLSQAENWASIAANTKLKHQEEDVLEEKVTLVVFKSGDQQYALTIQEVKEIIPQPLITPVPHTSDFIAGVGNVRGDVLTMLDMDRRIYGSSKEEYKFVLVIKSDEMKVGMLIQSIPNTITVLKSSINDSNSALQSLTEEDIYIKGIVKEQNEMIFMIDVANIF